MALTKSMAYDHPAYTAVLGATMGSLSGNAGVTGRFVAFSTIILKAVNISTVVAGTGALTDAKSLVILRGTSTSTGTLALATSTAAFFNFNVAIAGTSAFSTMTAGDAAWIVKGADATEVAGVTFEYQVAPGANVTP